MNDVGPARLIGIYGGTCFLVYLETNGFTKVSDERGVWIPTFASKKDNFPVIVFDDVRSAAIGAIVLVNDVAYATQGKVCYVSRVRCSGYVRRSSHGNFRF